MAESERSEGDWRELVALGYWVIEAMMSNNRSDLWFAKRDEFRLKASIALKPPAPAKSR